MIDKPLEQIAYADIDAFVQEQWPEGKTVDYKREAYGGKDDDKRELLKDVSSFANTLGGDILVGVEEDEGVPTGIPGIALNDADKEKLRLEGIIRHGLEPRIEFGIHHVKTPSASSVLVIRVQESLLLPHRVVFQGKFGEFWARSSAGKYSMDTDELRRAFTLSDSIYGQIKTFSRNRITQIVDGETPLPLKQGAKLVLHLIPVASFRSRQLFDVGAMPELTTKFPAMASGFDWRLNLDGHVVYSGGQRSGGCRSYTQFFRTGIVEAVLSDIVEQDTHGDKLLLAARYERMLVEHQYVSRFLTSLQELSVQPPIWCFLTLSGVKGARIPVDHYCSDENRAIDRDILSLPEAVIDNYGISPTHVLRPLFDLIWNASGYARSFNFDSDGKWIAR